MSKPLAGKIALITGASSGIGRAYAQALAREGAQLALVGRSAEKLAAVGAEIGGDPLLLPADLGQGPEVQRVVAASLGRFGRIDVLLANAGLYIPGDVAEGDPDAWDELLAVNVNSVFRAVRGVLPGMIAQGSGDVLVTSSVSGHQAIPWEPIYSASKHAIQAFVHGVRRQVAPSGVRVGAIAPGVVLNPLWGYDGEAGIDAKIAAREGIRSQDVAEAVVFMLTRPPHVTIRDLVILPQNQDI